MKIQLLLLLFAAWFLLGATNAGQDSTDLDGCDLHFMTGTNTATNREDACPQVAPSGRDQEDDNVPATGGGITCTETEIPPHMNSAQRSCLGDGDNNFFTIPDGTVNTPEAMAMWVYPVAFGPVNIFDHTFFTPGIRFGWRNCASGTKLQLRLWSQNNGWRYGSCGSVVKDEWNFIGWSWRGGFGQTLEFYSSNTAASNTLLDAGPYFLVYNYVDPGILMTMVAGIFATGPLNGYIMEYSINDGFFSSGGMCRFCRAGVGNRFRQNPVFGTWTNDAITGGLCNDCVLGGNNTHIGPRRTVN